MPLRLLPTSLVLILLATTAGATDEGIAFFEKEVRPVLAERCYDCHSARAKKLKGGLLLDAKRGWEIGGDSGPAIVPGDPDASLLIKAIRYTDIDFHMPPKKRLPKEEIAALEKWVKMGAPDPRSGEVEKKAEFTGIPTVESGRDYWAFQPIAEPPLPEVRNRDWPKTSIDHFTLANMESAGLTPTADAKRRDLIRRTYFNLIGLPPTPAQIDSFLADDSESAFDTVVQSLLSSPRFGERWGRHWLDVVRYAESSGGGRALLFPDAWRYRDYVIRAFNEDKPFDQFVREQIAGDLLNSDDPETRRDEIVATGLLSMGPTNYELQDKAALRMEVVDEQIDTIGRAFLGMTIGCARCHDHFFDPIPTKDYYALAGIFRSTKTLIHANVSTWVKRELPPTTEKARALTAQRAAYKKSEAAITATIKKAEAKLKSVEETLPSIDDIAILVDSSDAEKTGRWIDSAHVAGFVGKGYLHNDHGKSTDATVTFAPELPEPGRYEVRVSYTSGESRATKTPVTITHAEGSATMRINQRKTPPIDKTFLSLGTFPFDPQSSAVVKIAAKDAGGVVIADAVQFIPVAKMSPEIRAAKNTAGKARKELNRAKARLKNLKKNAPPKNNHIAMSVEDEKEAGDYHVCIRGSVHKPGEPVQRGFLSVISGSDKPEIPKGQSGRLQFADWVASSNNPLTARVVANRIWHHLFGQGLVRTPDNFGKMGELPSHPELLDHLAATFAQDWSVKNLITRIVQSRTYQLSASASDTATEKDPENRFLSHASRRRLDSESLRDTMIFLAGTLDTKMGGPVIPPSTKSEYDHVYSDTRRSIYLPVFRNALPEMLKVFDFPDPNIVNGNRTTSTLPTQALFLMNSAFVNAQAKAAVATLSGDKIERAYVRTLGRVPSDSERALAETFLAQHEDATTAWVEFQQSLFACLDFRYLE